ncbi:unnamed protein product [Owenia fusiformis]|uniref:Uncharacterized protein n=1 Tax=Owenia fusiformis TaxID=6347 RepID=A0A8S4NNZ7_OWEFU|nr:unnamed protein product [Owenia fusiformis]
MVIPFPFFQEGQLNHVRLCISCHSSNIVKNPNPKSCDLFYQRLKVRVQHGDSKCIEINDKLSNQRDNENKNVSWCRGCYSEVVNINKLKRFEDKYNKKQENLAKISTSQQSVPALETSASVYLRSSNKTKAGRGEACIFCSKSGKNLKSFTNVRMNFYF